MSGDKESLTQLLDMLSGSEQISIPRLYRLSDLTADEMSEFCECWSAIGEDRRRIVLRHLADITEENFYVDFGDIFSFCLTDESVAVRLASLDGLWDAERPALIEPVVALMETDPNVEVRSLAAATLGHFILLGEWGQIPDENVAPIIKALLQQLDSADTAQPVKKSALESIGAATHSRIPELLEKAYSNGDMGMRASSLYAMGRSADTRWLSRIIDEMFSPYEEIRIESARAAGAIGGSDAIPTLIELLYDDDLEVRMTAVTSLGQIGGDQAFSTLEALAADPFADELHETVEAALEELLLLGEEIDLSPFDWDNE